jgi:hypothetical protein
MACRAVLEIFKELIRGIPVNVRRSAEGRLHFNVLYLVEVSYRS